MEALDGFPEQYVNLYLALEGGGRRGERVSGTRVPPVPLAVEPEALMRDILNAVLTWVEPTAKAAGITGAPRPRRVRTSALRSTRVVRVQRHYDPGPQPGTQVVARDTFGDPVDTVTVDRRITLEQITPDDHTSGVALTSACRLLAAHADRLIALPPTWVWHWDADDGPDGAYQPVELTGVQAALSMIALRGRGRATLGLTRARDHMQGVPCPDCNHKLLYRAHGTDTVGCDHCGGTWSRDVLDRWTRMLAGEALTYRPSPQPDDWVTAREAATALRVPVSRVRRWAAELRFVEVWRDDAQHARGARRYVFADIAATHAALGERAEPAG